MAIKALRKSHRARGLKTIQQDIIQRTGMKQTTVSALVEALHDKQLIVREQFKHGAIRLADEGK
jgi:DNA-binding MarR family transcriptional regulator